MNKTSESSSNCSRSEDSRVPLWERHTLVECSDQGPIPVSTDSFELHHLGLRKWPLRLLCSFCSSCNLHPGLTLPFWS